MAAITRDHGVNDIYVDGSYLKVGQDKTVQKGPVDNTGQQTAPTSGNPRTRDMNLSEKVTFDVDTLPWEDKPEIVADYSGYANKAAANTQNKVTRADALGAKTIKLVKQAHSDTFYITTK